MPTQVKKETPKKEIKSVVSGVVKTKKKGFLEKAVASFIADDVSNIKEYIVKDVIIPTIQKTIVDLVNDTTAMMFGVKPSRGGSSSSDRFRGATNYVSYSDNGRSQNSRSSRNEGAYTIGDDLFFDSKIDAENVLQAMFDIVETYDTVSVAELYECAGSNSRNYTDTRYGWSIKELTGADVIRTRDGYSIKLPKAICIK